VGLDDFSECKKRGLRILTTNPLYPTILAREVENYFMRLCKRGYRTNGLTPRQWEYVAAFRKGGTRKEVADRMCVCEKAVAAIVRELCRSLECKDMGDVLEKVSAFEIKSGPDKVLQALQAKA
jgi:DNA-binding NarL/FixJ family response regulator